MTTLVTLVERLEKEGRTDLALGLEIASYVTKEIQGLSGQITDLQMQIREIRAEFAIVRRDRIISEEQEAEEKLKIARSRRSKIDTEEKIKIAMLEEKKDEQLEAINIRRKFWTEKILPNITTAMILSVLIPTFLAVFIGLIILVGRALGLQITVP